MMSGHMNITEAVINRANYLDQQCQVLLSAVPRWHMSSEDVIQRSKCKELDREWHVNAMLNNKP